MQENACLTPDGRQGRQAFPYILLENRFWTPMLLFIFKGMWIVKGGASWSQSAFTSTVWPGKIVLRGVRLFNLRNSERFI